MPWWCYGLNIYLSDYKELFAQHLQTQELILIFC